MVDQNKSQNREKDKITGVETTGHEWDGLKELNNPAPRWWLIIWVLCIVWSVGYWVIYPAWPTLENATKGSVGWTQFTELKESQSEITTLRGEKMAKIAATSLPDIKADKAMYEFAREAGSAAFKNNCAACHGSGAEGNKGFPNLNDDDWLWGGKLEDIYTTIRYGIRSAHEKTRSTIMPSFGKDGILKNTEIEDVVAYVASLSQKDGKAGADVLARGQKLFTDNCVACHSEGGVGNREMGAPRLNDAVWLYGGDHDTLVETVTNARAGQMPTWESRLDDGTIKALAIYVHGLGGGEK